MNPLSATQFRARSRSLRKTRSASPGSRSPAPATDAPASRDRTSGNLLRRTHRSPPDPTTRSAAHKKDGPELPPDPRGTKAPLAADAAYAFPSPWQDTTPNHPREIGVRRQCTEQCTAGARGPIQNTTTDATTLQFYDHIQGESAGKTPDPYCQGTLGSKVEHWGQIFRVGSTVTGAGTEIGRAHV